jgi:hypothetical protein
MGVNIYIAIEGWNSCANGGMKEIFRNDEKFPKVYRPSVPGSDPGDYDDDFRPSDFVKWRESILAQNINVEMWMRAIDAMEAEPDLWAGASS